MGTKSRETNYNTDTAISVTQRISLNRGYNCHSLEVYL